MKVKNVGRNTKGGCRRVRSRSRKNTWREGARRIGEVLFSIYLGGHLAFVYFVASALKGIVAPAAVNR